MMHPTIAVRFYAAKGLLAVSRIVLWCGFPWQALRLGFAAHNAATTAFHAARRLRYEDERSRHERIDTAAAAIGYLTSLWTDAAPPEPLR